MSQDIVERLRSLATIADAYSPEAYKEAADTIESLRARVAELEAENELLENKVMARDAELWGRTQEILSCKDQLAAKALTIKTMRTVLENFIDSHEECTDFDGFTAQIVSIDDYHEAQEALALPDNSTEVLQEWLDKQFGEPVAFITKDEEGGEELVFPAAIFKYKMIPEEAIIDTLYRKPEIK